MAGHERNTNVGLKCFFHSVEKGIAPNRRNRYDDQIRCIAADQLGGHRTTQYSRRTFPLVSHLKNGSANLERLVVDKRHWLQAYLRGARQHREYATPGPARAI